MLGALLDFSRIKPALSPSDGRLLAVLANPAATLPGGQSALLSLTGWSQSSVDALLTHFFGTADPASLSPVQNFRRVFDAYAAGPGLPADRPGAHLGHHQRAVGHHRQRPAVGAAHPLRRGGLADRDPPDQRRRADPAA